MAFIASSFNIAIAENAAAQKSTSKTLGSNAARFLNRKSGVEEAISSKDEERGIRLSALNRFKGLFRSHSTKAKEADFKKNDANEAFAKLKSIVGFKKTPTKLTPTKLRNIETYAHDNPSKWEAMTYYLEFFYALGLMIFLAGGAIYGVWMSLNS
ncbi:hypothetical protein P3T76_005878 [Phytophthora citrophthora]|uniref:Uncharacterized protein n=1 Tax=Phytophthora citrophthora TaxID=4793 RepID=A0AAD9GPU8_9STRA|nr:hypothetical protein P3T76_005878 [Phytophthora citrophthora]